MPQPFLPKQARWPAQPLTLAPRAEVSVVFWRKKPYLRQSGSGCVCAGGNVAVAVPRFASQSVIEMSRCREAVGRLSGAASRAAALAGGAGECFKG